MQKRAIWPKLAAEIATPEVVVITGPRQVGKTTTLKWLLDQIPSGNKLYIDLENLIDREIFETNNYETVVTELKNRGLVVDQRLYLAIDEIQLVANIPSVVKYLFDHYQIKFFLSGSSSYYIKHRFSESMAGRKVLYELLPLSFPEFLEFKNVEYRVDANNGWPFAEFSQAAVQQLDIFYQEYVEFGGLPRVVLTSEHDRKRRLLEEIYSSYINLDVQQLADFKSTADLRFLIKLLARRVGSRLNTSELASVLGVMRPTVQTYLNFLEQTYLIKLLPAYSRSLDVQTRMQKKVYFVDTGIAGVNADLSGGGKFENAIQHQLSLWSGQMFYYADKNSEVDFIVEYGGQRGAFEVKETPTIKDSVKLQKLALDIDIAFFRVIGKELIPQSDVFVWGGFIG